MRLIALTHGSQREPGTEFDEPDHIADILIKLGHAEKASEKKKETKVFETAAIEPEPMPAPRTTRRRSYARRDLRAED